LRGSLPVAILGVAIYAAIRVTLAAENEAEPLGIDTFLVRAFYLIALAWMFGYISEFEKKQNQKLLALSRTVGQISALQERRRIAFDLHDGILQSLATLILRLESCRKRFNEFSGSALETELRSMEELTRHSMSEIRQFLAGKESRPLTHGMLLKRLREELRFLQQGLGMEAILETEPEDVDLPDDVETELYYVLHEGLANVTRHSHASRVAIHLTQRGNTLEGILEDNGAGMRPPSADKQDGVGLTSMRERIQKIGGELRIQSSPGNGSKISFFVPLPSNS
jgi:signal transduction histidine kinase